MEQRHRLVGLVPMNMTPLLLLLLSLGCAPPLALQEGDLLFQTSSSGQSAAIAEAQAHPATHVGIAMQEDGRWWVLEAVGPVRRTSLSTFRNRGTKGAMVVMRDPRLSPSQRTELVAAARVDLGKPYDIHFTDSDDRIYCSELVARAYQRIGLEVGRRQQVSELAMAGPKMNGLLLQRWRSHPLCTAATDVDQCRSMIQVQTLITPASMMTDDRLVHIDGALP
jgi:hypothetical protein